MRQSRGSWYRGGLRLLSNYPLCCTLVSVMRANGTGEDSVLLRFQQHARQYASLFPVGLPSEYLVVIERERVRSRSIAITQDSQQQLRKGCLEGWLYLGVNKECSVHTECSFPRSAVRGHREPPQQCPCRPHDPRGASLGGVSYRYVASIHRGIWLVYNSCSCGDAAYQSGALFSCLVGKAKFGDRFPLQCVPLFVRALLSRESKCSAINWFIYTSAVLIVVHVHLFVVLRWTIVIRTHHAYKNLYVIVFLRSVFGPDYYCMIPRST